VYGLFQFNPIDSSLAISPAGDSTEENSTEEDATEEDSTMSPSVQPPAKEVTTAEESGKYRSMCLSVCKFHHNNSRGLKAAVVFGTSPNDACSGDTSTLIRKLLRAPTNALLGDGNFQYDGQRLRTIRRWAKGI
jgi:hypothetical protein